jgi:hypothetical protein
MSASSNDKTDAAVVANLLQDHTCQHCDCLRTDFYSNCCLRPDNYPLPPSRTCPQWRMWSYWGGRWRP